MLFFSKKNKDRGMTLVELIVVMGVIALISGVTWINFRVAGRVFELERDANLMAQNIRRSLETTMAMADIVPADCRTYITSDNIITYGVNLSVGASTYQRMAYIINANRTSPDFGSVVCEAEIEGVIFEEGVIQLIETIDDGETTTTSTIRIIFTPPHPRTFIGGISTFTISGVVRWQSLFEVAIITINISGTTDIRKVEINQAGLITVI